MKKFVAVILALCLMLSLSTVAFAADYKDVSETFWGKKAIDNWTANGIFQGDDDGNFNPGSYMKRAEAAAIMARLFKLTVKGDISKYTDIQDGVWFEDYFALCVAAGIMNGTSDKTMDPLSNLTREQFFVMFARGLGIPQASFCATAIADEAEISDWAKGYIYALVNSGYLKGTSATNTTISPKDYINRASVAALLDQTISLYAALAGTADYEGAGIVLVVADGVAVTDAPAGTMVVTKAVSGTTVNGVEVPGDSVYVVPEETTPADDQGEGNQGGIPVIPTKTHRQIIDEAVQLYISGYNYEYAKLTKNAYTINVSMLDPSVQIGRVYSDIGENILKALKNQMNPGIAGIKASLNGQEGQLAITADKTVVDIHDLVYEVTGFAGNNTIGELDGQTIKVSFIDSDYEVFEYSFVFAIEG